MRRDGDRIIRLTPEPVWDTDEPLYTAPRELSDEEILDCLEKSDLPMILLSDFATEKMKVFARAILKKASEK